MNSVLQNCYCKLAYVFLADYVSYYTRSSDNTAFKYFLSINFLSMSINFCIKISQNKVCCKVHFRQEVFARVSQRFCKNVQESYVFRFLILNQKETQIRPTQITMELDVKLVENFQPLTGTIKNSFLDIVRVIDPAL